MNNIRVQSIKAVSWSAIDGLGRQGIQFFISIILARLLVPSEFGLLGMLALFTGLAGTFVDSGFTSALIQRRKPTQTDISSVFYFNILLGTIMALILVLTAPFIASFYDIPLLTPLARLSALSLFIGSFSSVQGALRTRDLDFKTQTKISLIATVLSGGLGVGMAWRGYGVWSLAWQGVAASFVSTILLWFFRTWRPSFLFSFASLRSLFSFGSRLLLSGLLDTFFSRIYLVVIGKVYSPADLGFYTRAYSTQQLPAGLLSSVVNRVAFPIFSSVSHDQKTMKKGLRKAISWLMMINLPLMLGVFVTARPLVLVLFTDKWAPCIPYLQVLCVAGILWPLQVINLNALNSMGRSDLFFRLEVIKKVLALLVLLLTFQISVMAMVWGQAALSIICYFLNAYYLGKLLNYSAPQQIRDFSPYLLCALIMTGASHALSYLPIHSLLLLLVGQTLLGAVVYLALCHLWKLSAFHEAVKTIRQSMGRLRTRYA